MKILHITDSLIAGGKERQLIELLKGLEQKGGTENELILLKNINHYPESEYLKTPIHVFERKIKKDPTIFFKIKEVVKNFKPDIIQSWGSMPSIYALPIVLSKKIKFLNFAVQNAICKKWKREWRRSKITFPFSDVIVANSYAGIEAYPADLHKSYVLYNGVHLDRFNDLTPEQEIRDKFNIKAKYIIGMVGAFHPRKDYYTFLKAAKKVVAQRDDVCFIAIGDGRNMEECKNLVSGISEDKIKFLGRQSDVESIVNIFTIGVLCTNTDVHREGIANVLIEYMALGKPAVATLGGGTPEIVDNYYNGLVVRPHDEDELSQKINYLIDNPEILKRYGERAKEKAQTGFAVDIMVDSFIELYKKLV